ncbi:MAG TPA: CoA transferase [Candidatus Binatia bacterium]|jgi:crotonobetainyl-CoA:carnitine CoA-transferase CaiB-like acyl-CoA transferase
MATAKVTFPAPLAGIRILDFTHVLAGPFCTRLLADLGADVVRVESRKHPDHPWPSTFISEDGRHASYLNTNRNKRSIAIDLKKETGQRLAARLAAIADVVIENFSAGVMDRLKLGYERIKEPNPKVIYVSMSGYGHNGPRRDWTSMNMNLQGYSGLMMVSGTEIDPPTAISNSWNDYIGGLHACFAILQAIDKRTVDSQGTQIDLSQFECSASMIGSLLLSSAVDGKAPVRAGNRSDRFAPQGVYPCAGTDNWCAVCIATEKQWEALAKLIAREHWSAEPRFATVAGRMQHHDEIDRAISNWSKQYSSNEVEERLTAAGIGAERVRRINDVVDSPDVPTVFCKMAEWRVGSMLTTGLPFSLSLVDLPAPHSAPSLGEHSVDVLRTWLHCSATEIEEIQQQEVLE